MMTLTFYSDSYDKKIPVLSYDREKIEKWLLQPLLKDKDSITETKKVRIGFYEKKSPAVMKKIIKNLKKLFSNARYVSLYSASFLLAALEKRTGHSPQQECEMESIFCVQRLAKNDARWRLGNENPLYWSL